MKKVINFVKGKRDEKKDKTVNSNICVEITNPLGQKVPSEDEHIVGLQSGYGYEVDFTGKDKSMTKLHKAAWQGNLEKVKIHLKKFDINAVDEFNRSPLHLAAAQGHTNVVCFLLNNKAIPDISDSDGMTPFLKAVDCGVKECVGLMVEKGVNISSVDNNGNTALHITARQGFFNIMSLLLKNGANCNSANNAGEMALHIATEQEHRDLVELLLQAGAQVNVVDAENRTPLMLAARVGQSPIVSLLFKYGAHLDACDNNGWTAEDYSMIGGHEQLALELKIPQSSAIPPPEETKEDKQEDMKEDKEEDISDSNDAEPAEEPSKDPVSEPREAEGQPEPEEDTEESQAAVKSPPYTCLAAGEEPLDSPRSCVTPPPLNPPRSWEIIQAGMIDHTQVRRRSLMALGTLESHRNSFVENGNSSGNSNGNVKGDDIEAFDCAFLPPAVNIIIEGDMPDLRDSDAEWDSDDSLPLDRSLPPPPDFPDSSLESCLLLPELVLTPDPSLPPQIPELIITPDRRSRITLERTPSLDLTDSEIMISPDGTLGREGTMKCSDEIWEAANIPSPTENANKQQTVTNVTVHDTGQTNLNANTSVENSNTMDNLTVITNFKIMNQTQKESKRYVRESQSLDNLDDCGSKYSEIESSQSCDKLDSEQFSGVYSLETEGSTNEVFTQSLDSLEEESPVGTVVKRNVFHESHSLELLDEAKQPSRHHVRNKSVAVSSCNWSKSVDVLSKPSKSEVTCLDARSIDEQLQCYDEALRELAEEQKVKEELLMKVLEGRPYAKCNLNQSLSCDMLEPKTGAVPKTGLSFNQKESSRSQRLNSSVQISSLSNSTEGKHPMKKSNTVDVLSLKYCPAEKTVESNVKCLENYPRSRSQTKTDQLNKEGACMSRAERNLPPVAQKYCANQRPSKQRSNSTCSRNKIGYYENKHKFYNSLELPPRNRKGKGSRSESNFSGITDWKQTLTVSSMPESQNECKNFSDTAQSSKTPSEIVNRGNGSPKRPIRVKKLRKEMSDTTYTKKSDDQDKRKAVGRSISLYMERMKYEELPKKPSSENKDHLLSEKSGSDSDWSERPLHHKRKQFVAMRDAIVDSEDSDEDPPFWVSTGKDGCFSRQDTVIHNQHASASSGVKKDSDEEKSGGEGNEDITSSSDSGSASISPSDATPSHSFILKSHHSMLKDHLKQTTEEKAKLEEAAAKLKEQNDRIQYDLADANQSIVVRDDKILILQDELSRLSSKYSTTLDELNMLKQRLTTAEIELKHLRDLTRVNVEKQHTRPDPNTQQLIKQLHETNKAKKRIEFEKETLISQHIMDIRKLQQDTIHWKNLYEEALSKLEQIEALCDPCLLENNQHIDKIKAAFKKFRDEKNSGRFKMKTATSANENCIESKEKTLELEENLDTNKEVYCLEDAIIDNQVATLQLQLQQEKSRSSALENQVQKMLLDLQKKLDLEAELENLNRRLEKEFVPRVELEQLRANQETAIARIRQQALLESETKLNAKLTEINQILQMQLQEQSQKERQREIVESQMKQEFENTRQKLLLELSRVQAALKAKESEERILREQCDAMSREAEKAQELKRRQLIEKSYSVNLADPSTTREKELTVKRSVVPPPPPPPPLAPPPLDLALVDANSLRQQLERSISKHRDIHMSRVNDDRSRSPPGRSQQ